MSEKNDVKLKKISYDLLKKKNSIKKYAIYGVILLALANLVILPFFVNHRREVINTIKPIKVNHILQNYDEKIETPYLYSDNESKYFMIMSFSLKDIYDNRYIDMLINEIKLMINISKYIEKSYALLYTIDTEWDYYYITYNEIENSMHLYQSVTVSTNKLNVSINTDILNYNTTLSLNLGITVYTSQAIKLLTQDNDLALIINFKGISKEINIIAFIFYLIIMITGLYMTYTSIVYSIETKKRTNKYFPPYFTDSMFKRREKIDKMNNEFTF